MSTNTISHSEPQSYTESTPAIIEACCSALDAKKAENIRALYLGENSSLTDYYIIAIGNSPPHLKALSESIKLALKEANWETIQLDAQADSGWIVIDAFDFMVHLFTQEQYDYYRLEDLWKDSKVIVS